MTLPLTKKEYKRLKTEERLSDKEIADSLFIGTATLSRWKKRVGVKAGRDPEDYLKLKNKGYRDWQIAQKWGIVPSALYLWKKAKGLV